MPGASAAAGAWSMSLLSAIWTMSRCLERSCTAVNARTLLPFLAFSSKMNVILSERNVGPFLFTILSARPMARGSLSAKLILTLHRFLFRILKEEQNTEYSSLLSNGKFSFRTLKMETRPTKVGIANFRLLLKVGFSRLESKWMNGSFLQI